MKDKRNEDRISDQAEYSQIAHRLAEVRQFRKLKQSYVGICMGITQQAYSILENSKGSIGMNTLLRFCKATNVSLELLLATSLPITEENVQLFNTNDMAAIIDEYRGMHQRLKFYESMISVKMAS